MKSVSIIYCKPCGYLKRATDAAAALERKFGVTAELVPGKGGIFEVRVGDKVVAKRVQGHFPGTAEIVEAVAAVTKAR